MNRVVMLLGLSCLLIVSTSVGAESRPPYPRSELLSGITFEESTLRRLANGSDIWACTWAADGNLYGTWGDGGGFGGSDEAGRVSLGVARISGTPPDWQGINIWGGVSALSGQPPTEGKATIIAVNRTLYLYTSEQGRWDRCRLWKSVDYGHSWQNRGWLFPTSHKAFSFPGLVQFGRDNQLSPDGYIYGFSDNDTRRLHDMRLYLFRVRPSQLESLTAYEYFVGTEQHPRWSHDIQKMTPVFSNPEGISWGTTCVYHATTGRYLLAVSSDEDQGDWGLYESTHLWGPWHTIGYRNEFPDWTYSPAEKKRPAYLHTFPAKWMSQDGKTLWCVFDRGDHFNLARCTLTVKAAGRQ